MDKKYIGKKEVESFTETPSVTPLGGKVLNVLFKDGTTQLLTEKSYKNMLSEAETDATALQDLKCKPVCQEILALMAEANLNLGEINHTIQLTAASVDQNAAAAINKLFKVEYSDQRSMLAMDAILKGNEPDSY